MDCSVIKRCCLVCATSLALLTAFSGCFAVHWADQELHSELLEDKPLHKEKLREIRIEPVVAEDASTLNVLVTGRMLVTEQPITKYNKVFWRKKLVIGFFPGIGSNHYSGNEMGAQMILKGGGIIVINVLTLGIATVVSWCFEPFSPWEPHLEASLIGAVKTGYNVTEPVTEEGERTEKIVDGPLEGLEVTCAIRNPAAPSSASSFVLTQKTRRDGIAVFNPSRFPAQIGSSPTVAMTIEVPGAALIPPSQAVELPSDRIGGEFLRLAWMGRVSGGTVLTDEGVVSFAPGSGGGSPKAEVAASAQVEATSEGTSRVVLNMIITNSGDGDLNRVIGRTRSQTPGLDGQYLLFGRIPAGASSSRALAMPLQGKDAGAAINLEIEFKEQNSAIPGVYQIPVAGK
ncbi:MAG TPA: hypothetical protein PL033_03200 [Candidatus Brocadiia bacterium]|nr:hypothetical protein [Candidatus Brocadiia bacterium]